MNFRRAILLIGLLASPGAIPMASAQQASERVTPPPLLLLPPPPATVRTPPDEQLARPAPTNEIVEAVTLCMQAVTLEHDVSFSPFVDQGWLTEPTMGGQNSLGSFTLYSFTKNDVAIGVRNYKGFATCSVISISAGPGQLAEVTASLAADLNALPPEQVESLAAFRADRARQDPSGSHKFLFLPGQALEIEVGALGGKDALVVTNSPLSLEP